MNLERELIWFLGLKTRVHSKNGAKIVLKRVAKIETLKKELFREKFGFVLDFL